MIMDVKRKLHSERGQGILEFLVFLPFMLMMYSVTMSLSNAINASINQQKIARAYWHYRNLNNSTIPRPRRDGQKDSWKIFGMQIMGWAEKLEGGKNTPFAPCFKFVLPLGEDASDKCEETYTGVSSQFIRVQTVYGICGATYGKGGESGNEIIDFPRGALEAGITENDHCVLIE